MCIIELCCLHEVGLLLWKWLRFLLIGYLPVSGKSASRNCAFSVFGLAWGPMLYLLLIRQLLYCRAVDKTWICVSQLFVLISPLSEVWNLTSTLSWNSITFLTYIENAMLLHYFQTSDKVFGSVVFTGYVVCVLDIPIFLLLVLVIQHKETYSFWYVTP